MTDATKPKNFRAIYDRHQGPYVLLLTRENEKGIEFTDRITGTSLRAQAAHEKAIELIENRDPKKPDVTRVFVFSETEGQFTGALYSRGEAYAAWEHLPIDDAPPAPKPKPVTVKEQKASRDAVESPTTEAGVPPKPRPAKLPGDRFPAMRGRPLVAQLDGEWPKSAAAQFVRSFYAQQGPEYSATSAELVAAIGQSLTDLGVQFPASLISRLKQAGLLVEKTYKETTDEAQ